MLDTNVISDIINPKLTAVRTHFAAHRQHTLCLCEPVDYEVQRGYLKVGALTKLKVYEQKIKPQFQWVNLVEADWQQAAQLWAATVNKGKQLSDIDLLIASVAKRLGGIIVSADEDFNALPVIRNNWRSP